MLPSASEAFCIGGSMHGKIVPQQGYSFTVKLDDRPEPITLRPDLLELREIKALTGRTYHEPNDGDLDFPVEIYFYKQYMFTNIDDEGRNRSMLVAIYRLKDVGEQSAIKQLSEILRAWAKHREE